MHKEAIEFFTAHGAKAMAAARLARAEAVAEERKWEFDWQDEADPDLSWLSDAERAGIEQVCFVSLYDENEELLSTVTGIIDPTDDERRVVEAAAALGALIAAV